MNRRQMLFASAGIVAGVLMPNQVVAAQPCLSGNEIFRRIWRVKEAHFDGSPVVWLQVRMKDLKVGDRFCMQEPDEERIPLNLCDRHTVIDPPAQDRNGIWCVKTSTEYLDKHGKWCPLPEGDK